MGAEARAAEVEAREKRGAMQAKDLGTLEYDPATGQYRPKRARVNRIPRSQFVHDRVSPTAAGPLKRRAIAA